MFYNEFPTTHVDDPLDAYKPANVPDEDLVLVGNPCPMCHRMSFMWITTKEDEGTWLYTTHEVKAQDAFPTLNSVEREFMITGYCPECQKKIFGNGETTRIVIGK